MENTKSFTHTTQVEVRYAETDAMGIVHHATYPIWFEVARIDYFKELGATYVEMEKEGFMCPVIELNVRYRRPCRFGDTVVIETTLMREGNLKAKFEYKAYLNGELCTMGYSIHAFIKNGMPTRDLPECLKNVAHKIFPDEFPEK